MKIMLGEEEAEEAKGMRRRRRRRNIWGGVTEFTLYISTYRAS